MKWLQAEAGSPNENSRTSFSLTKEGSIRVSAEETEVPEPELVTSFEEWKRIAGAWPVKRLVALWNDLPGVIPVVKFTRREIASEFEIAGARDLYPNLSGYSGRARSNGGCQEPTRSLRGRQRV